MYGHAFPSDRAGPTGATRRARRASRSLVLLGALALGACSLWHRGGDRAAAADPLAAGPDTQAIVLVRYGNWTRTLAAAELERELQVVQEALDHDPTAWARLRMAFLLTVPGSATRNDPRALELLDDVRRADPPKGSQYQEVAQLLASLVATSPGDPATAEADRDHGTDTEVRSLRNALAAERGRRRELEQQVVALRQLENNLTQRTRAPD